MSLFPNLFAGAKAKHLSVCCFLQRFSLCWEPAFFNPLSLEEHEELQQLRGMVDNCMLSSTPDLLIWRWNNLGLFTSRTAYSFLVNSGVLDCKLPFLWQVKAPLRVKVFL